jgi:catechol 2,3-dioxygenase-like lactoylglutathione lyase family enzyme
MVLGSSVQIVVPVPNIADAASFYKRLGYHTVASSADAAVLSDGMALFRFEHGPNARAGLRYASEHIERGARELAARGFAVTREMRNDGDTVRVWVRDPNGVVVRLDPVDAPDSPTLSGIPLTRCGRFQELSIETEHFDETETFWTQLGFEVTERSDEARYLTLSDGLIHVGVYEKGVCPHIFRTPAITYFEADMAARLAQLKSEGWTFAQELDLGNEDGIIDHGILEGPGGEHLFLFTV